MSVAAKRVMPCELEFSWLWILVSSWKSFKRVKRVMRVCEPFSSMTVVKFNGLEGVSVGPGAGAGAGAGAWAFV